MRTETGYMYNTPELGMVRVTIPRYVFKGEPLDNFQFRTAMSGWIRENCKQACFEYPSDVSIYPHALWITEDLALIFKLKWAV